MNDAYPKNHEDYDLEFLVRTLKAFFGIDELNLSVKNNSLENVKRTKLVFLKGDGNLKGLNSIPMLTHFGRRNVHFKDTI